VAKKEQNVGPRTEPARRAAILMNRIKHRPKSIPIQTENEVVIQVRGDFDLLVKKLRKVFKSKGKDTSLGGLREHDWKLKGLGFMHVYWREGNAFNSVRFINVPGLGIKEEPEETSDPTLDIIATEAKNAAKEGLKKTFEILGIQPDEEDLDAVILE
jgi:hypothetical protein